MIWWQKKPCIDVINSYDNMSEREQKIVLFTVISLLLSLSLVVILEPLFIANQSLYSAEEAIQNKKSKIVKQIENARSSQHQDPNDLLRKELNVLNSKAEILQAKISLLTQALVAPKQMVSLLESVLTQDKQLKLVSLTNLPEQGMGIGEGKYKSENDREEKDEGDLEDIEDESLIYQHAFEIELEATYDSSIAYLKRLDKLPWQLFWQTLEYESTQYPKGKLKIRIYTLSMSKAVLGV